MSDHINLITESIIAAALKVHGVLGPGLYESAHEDCLAYELQQRGHRVDRQVPVPVIYEALKLPVGYRAAMVVDRLVVVEIKACDGFHPRHKAQLLTYVRLLQRPAGLLLNFNEAVFGRGIRRVVWGPDAPSKPGAPRSRKEGLQPDTEKI